MVRERLKPKTPPPSMFLRERLKNSPPRKEYVVRERHKKQSFPCGGEDLYINIYFSPAYAWSRG